MTNELVIRCSCGGMQGRAGRVDGDNGTRIVCYCDDCQSFAHFLGRGSEILNKRGGTDIFQMSPAGVEFTAGTEHLACMRLRPKGLLRWYAACCMTPIGNTVATRHVPFVGLITTCINPDRRALDGPLGPVSVRVHGRFAKGGRDDLYAHDRVPLALIFSTFGRILRRRIRGDHKRSPFFDPKTGEPAVAPKTLSKSEHEDIKRLRDAGDLMTRS